MWNKKYTSIYISQGDRGARYRGNEMKPGKKTTCQGPVRHGMCFEAPLHVGRISPTISSGTVPYYTVSLRPDRLVALDYAQSLLCHCILPPFEILEASMGGRGQGVAVQSPVRFPVICANNCLSLPVSLLATFSLLPSVIVGVSYMRILMSYKSSKF